MTDVTAGRAAGTQLNAELDPTGRSDAENRRLNEQHELAFTPERETSAPSGGSERKPRS